MAEIVITTERLQLEKPNETHFEGLVKLLANKKVMKHFPKILNREEAREYYDLIQSRYKRDGYSFCAVVRKEDKQFLGICGVLKQLVDGVEEAEIGYRFIDTYWGKGYATEAAYGCMEYAKKELGKESIISLILPENIESQRVAERNGLTVEKETLYADLLHRVYRKPL